MPLMHKAISATVAKGIAAGFAQISTELRSEEADDLVQAARTWKHICWGFGAVLALVFALFVAHGLGLLGHGP